MITSIRRARLRGREGLHTLRLAQGTITEILPEEGEEGLAGRPAIEAMEGQAAGAVGQGRQGAEINAAGCLVSIPFCDTHQHLDTVLTAGQPRHNRSGTLWEGIEIWGERRRELTTEDVTDRARTAVLWEVGRGCCYIRSHVDVGDPRMVALKAILALREELSDIVRIEIVAFPQDGVYTADGSPELLEEALRLGADLVGGIPHNEYTRELGLKQLGLIFDLAEKYDRGIDVHCDETDDPHSRFIETLAAGTIERGLSGRVTASHATAMHSYDNAYAFKLIRLLALSGLHVVCNPFDNSVLQARQDTYPKRRGLTRVKELLEAGVNVALGHDTIVDPWYPLGCGDMLHAAFLVLHMCQLSGHDEIPLAFDLATSGGARAMGLDAERPEVGVAADLVVHQAPTEADLLRLLLPPAFVLKGARVVASSTAPEIVIRAGGAKVAVDYLQPEPTL